MIDFETDLRDQLSRTADAAPVGTDLLPAIERRVAAADRRASVARAGAVVVVLALAAGSAVALAARDDGEGTTRATEASSGSTTTEPGATTTVPLALGWADAAAAPLDPRTMAATARVGDRVFVWGGMALTGADPADYHADGALYDPTADTWTTIAPSPLPPGYATAVAADEKVMVVSNGPLQGQGRMGPAAAAAYDPATDTWRALSDPPADLETTAAVWTGDRLLAVPTTTRDDQRWPLAVSVYDPASDTWTTGAETDSVGVAGAVWTGTEVVVVGTVDSDPTDPADEEVVVQAYDPATDTWRSIPWGLTQGSRVDVVVAWTGDRLFVGGGMTWEGDEMLTSHEAALLDPATGTWTPTAPTPVGIFGPLRQLAPVTEDGRVVVLAGSDDGMPAMGLGSVAPVTYDPATDTWTSGSARPGGGLPYATAETWVAGRVVVTSGTIDGAAAGTATYVP